jgi:hypothetical protein
MSSVNPFETPLDFSSMETVELREPREAPRDQGGQRWKAGLEERE